MRRLLPVTLLLAFAVAACAPGGGGVEEAASPRDAGPAVLDFRAPLVGGGTFDGGDHDGRDVALWFWAPW